MRPLNLWGSVRPISLNTGYYHYSTISLHKLVNLPTRNVRTRGPTAPSALASRVAADIKDIAC